MREIKFRAWDNNKETLCNITDINFSDYSANGVCFGEWSEFSVNNLMQYTGLKDKNGIDIYEGDICRCYGGEYFQGYYEYNGVYEVKYSGNSFDMIQNNCGLCWGMSNATDYIEVIGNIYNHRFLLDNN